MQWKTAVHIAILFLVVAYTTFVAFNNQLLSLVLPYLPTTRYKNAAYYEYHFNQFSYELLWLGLFLLLAWLYVSIPFFSFGVSRVESWFSRNPKTSVWVILASFFCLALITAFFILNEFPNSSDEYVYLMQARMLSEGKLWEQAHPLSEFFQYNNLIQKDGISVGRFPPGWPLVLSVSFSLHVPSALINPILATISLAVFYNFTKKIYGARIGFWSTATLALSAFFIFNSSSFFSHTVCLLETVLFVHFLYAYAENKRLIYGILAGFFLGLIIITRYYTAVLIFIPFFITLIHQYRFRSLLLFVSMGIGALPCLTFLLWYNHTVTGNPLLPVTVWGDSEEGIGFIKGHTLLKGCVHVLRRLCAFLYWVSPLFLVGYFIYVFRKIRNAQSRFTNPEDYLFLALILGYILYYEIGGNQYGPRFYFEALPFLIVFVVARIFNAKNSPWLRGFFYAAILCAVLKFPFVASVEHQAIMERQDVYQLVKEKNITNAVVLLSSATGFIKPMPVGDLTRNDSKYTNDVLYAFDFGEKNVELMKFYKDKSFYRYERAEGKVCGELVLIE